MNGLPLEEMGPDTRAVKHAGAYARVLSSPQGNYAVYFDGNGPISVTFDLPRGDYSGEWMDPPTGTVTGRESFSHPGGVKIVRTPEFRDGLAFHLLLRTKERN